MKIFILVLILSVMAVIAWGVIKYLNRDAEKLRQKSIRLEESMRKLNDRADDLIQTLDDIDDEFYP